MYVVYFDYPLWIPPLIFAVVVDPLHYITGGFYFGALGNATAYSILTISDGGLKYVFIHGQIPESLSGKQPLHRGAGRTLIFLWQRFN